MFETPRNGKGPTDPFSTRLRCEGRTPTGYHPGSHVYPITRDPYVASLRFLPIPGVRVRPHLGKRAPRRNPRSPSGPGKSQGLRPGRPQPDRSILIAFQLRGFRPHPTQSLSMEQAPDDSRFVDIKDDSDEPPLWTMVRLCDPGAQLGGQYNNPQEGGVVAVMGVWLSITSDRPLRFQGVAWHT